jgi:hypothetical protein
MSAMPGKVLVDDIVEVGGQQVFALKVLQGRRAEWANRLFFARFDPEATWFDQLVPAFGDRFFFSDELDRMLHEPMRHRSIESGHVQIRLGTRTDRVEPLPG